MATQRQRYSAACNARVALAARKGPQTVHEFAGLEGVHPSQMTQGKHRLPQEVPDIFSARRTTQAHDQEALQAQ